VTKGSACKTLEIKS